MRKRKQIVLDSTVECKWCGQQAHYIFSTGNICCCSKTIKCFGLLFRSEDRSGPENGNWKGGPVKVYCAQCGKEKFVKRKTLKWQVNFFCNKQCQGKWRKQNGLVAKRRGFWIDCAYCGMPKWVTPAGFRNSKTKLFFCSSKCFGKWLSVFKKGRNSPTWKGGKVKVECEICGKVREIDPGEYEKSESKKFYCRECFLEKMIGRGIPWNIGLTKETDVRVALAAEKVSNTKQNWSEEKRKELSEGASKRIIKRILDNPELILSYGKAGHFFSEKNNRELFYRSSYELLAFNILEQLSKVKKYEVETIQIPYEYQGRQYNTIPDILVTYIDNTKELIEVKSSFKMKDEKENTKIWAMNDYAALQGWDFNVWTEKELNIN